ncbi:MAG TPA: MBL fold metallo-hydrolase [Micromonosporaceae bacterium]|nr:MBL fold metallo-hydrolase [Micromonosporaceae bacterium]
MADPGFVEVGDRVHVLRYPVFDVNVALVLGDGAALLVDTLSTPAQGAELARAARRVTAAPWSIVNTHHHFDHCVGNAVLARAGGDSPVWAHEATAALLRDGARVRRRWYEELAPSEPELAGAVAGADLLPPDRTVHWQSTVDIGGRAVVLHHLGRGHTAGDLVVEVPDAGVVLAGDLVEESGPPSFEDAYPLEWPETLARLLRLTGPDTTVVPGHGAVVDQVFVRAQHADLTALEWLVRDGHADGAPPAAVAARAPFGPQPSLVAVRRGYAELAGRI